MLRPLPSFNAAQPLPLQLSRDEQRISPALANGIVVKGSMQTWDPGESESVSDPYKPDWGVSTFTESWDRVRGLSPASSPAMPPLPPAWFWDALQTKRKNSVKNSGQTFEIEEVWSE